MLRFVLFVVLLSLCNAQAPVCDPTLTSFHADKLSCTQYYTCFNGVATLQTCPDQKYYDASRTLCDIPANVPCTIGPCTGTTGLTTVAIPGDCTGYKLCLNGTEFDMKCATGTLYDATYGDCVMAKNSKCEENPCLTVDPATASPSTFYPSSKLCKNYIICNKQTPVVRTCLSATVFSPTVAKCVPPAEYTCPPGTF
ncbi:peritrophin-44-like [Anopheles ziemanni]|uniref:peritrophin-44-like n=1 Tax=Anopheles coustani TaxID=139045 RepID=UPI002658324A|nr:peritrophin-44-like [Anopheles coustani]XP_058169976.1 peritrophin-44-like [Anopheles ziemanni]